MMTRQRGPVALRNYLGGHTGGIDATADCTPPEQSHIAALLKQNRLYPHPRGTCTYFRTPAYK
eukprot:20681-Eustigmatos_ZCMA.PRE.1